MTVTNLNAGAEPDVIAETVRRIFAEVSEASRRPDLTAVHAVIKEAGIRSARKAITYALVGIEEAQTAYRCAQAVEAVTKEARDGALLEAEWDIDSQLHTDGNKRYRWVVCECVDMTGGPSSGPTTDCPVCSGAGKVRKFMLADDVKAWKAAESARVPAVVTLTDSLVRAQEDTAAARDSINVAEKRFSASKADLQAAIAELQALAIGLTSKEA